MLHQRPVSGDKSNIDIQTARTKRKKKARERERDTRNERGELIQEKQEPRKQRGTVIVSGIVYKYIEKKKVGRIDPHYF